MGNIYMPELADVVDVKEETSNIRSLLLALKEERPFECVPGQFVELTVFGYGEFPVSIAEVIDHPKGRFKVTIQKIGKVTKEAGKLKVGSQIGVRGPFGNGFPLDYMAGKEVQVVSGGVGLAAVWHLLRHLDQHIEDYKKVTLLHGARTPAEIIYKEELENFQKNGRFDIFLTVDKSDNGWAGHVGLVTELLKRPASDAQGAVAIVCGPGVMMKAAAAGFLDLGLPEDNIFLSMERRMQCGMGACGHCMVGLKRVCLDGPVLSYKDIRSTLEKIF